MVDAPCIHPRTIVVRGRFLFVLPIPMNDRRREQPWLLLLNVRAVSEDFVAISRY
jgi:hypothetical protein